MVGADMKILHASDIHGDVLYAWELVRVARKLGADIICCTGDFCYRGEKAADVLRVLAEFGNVVAVWGDDDEYYRVPSKVDPPDGVEFVDERRLRLNGFVFSGIPTRRGIVLTHVPPPSFFDPPTLLLGDARKRRWLKEEPLCLLCGHLHFFPKVRLVRTGNGLLLWSRAGARKPVLIDLERLSGKIVKIRG